MIYRSNLACPDLLPQFKHVRSRSLPHSFSHDVPSDWYDKPADDPVFGLYKKCGLWTQDEAAILYNVANTRDLFRWVDIGAHTGWTTAHIVQAGAVCCSVDPLYRLLAFQVRFEDNIGKLWANIAWVSHNTSAEFFAKETTGSEFEGFCIDGDHSAGKPLEDARNSAAHLTPTGVIMLHDGSGRPVREAVEWLMAHGFKARAYFTPHLVFCCWRGDFTPPDHEPDPAVKAAHLDGRYPDFDFGRMK